MHMFSAVICIYGIIISGKMLTCKLRCTNKNKINWKIKIKTILKETTLQLHCHEDVSMALPAQKIMWQEAVLITRAKRDQEGWCAEGSLLPDIFLFSSLSLPCLEYSTE